MSRIHATRPLTVAAVALLSSIALAGCGGNGLTQSSAYSGTSSSTTPTPKASEATPTESPSPSKAGDSAAEREDQARRDAEAQVREAQRAAELKRRQICPASSLGVTTDGGDGAAGSQYFVLTFRNRSSHTCVLDGHPGVSFVGKSNGTQLGEPASRTGAVRRVSLDPGEHATALLKIANAGNYDRDECIPTTADGLRVYPPDSRASVFVPLRIQACQGKVAGGSQMSVSEVRPATS